MITITALTNKIKELNLFKRRDKYEAYTPALHGILSAFTNDNPLPKHSLINKGAHGNEPALNYLVKHEYVNQTPNGECSITLDGKFALKRGISRVLADKDRSINWQRKSQNYTLMLSVLSFFTSATTAFFMYQEFLSRDNPKRIEVTQLPIDRIDKELQSLSESIISLKEVYIEKRQTQHHPQSTKETSKPSLKE